MPQPFDHTDWIFEIKYDGFRGLAYVERGRCRLYSRNGHEFHRWPQLAREISGSVQCESAVLDGEIVCLDADGRSNFYTLMFRRRLPFFCAFDALAIDGEDLRSLPLLERKRRLLNVMPTIESRVRYVDHVHDIGVRFFALACERDLEGVVGKFGDGIYQRDGAATSWVKFKNSTYTQAEGRAELFESRRGAFEGPRRRTTPPRLVIT